MIQFRNHCLPIFPQSKVYCL